MKKTNVVFRLIDVLSPPILVVLAAVMAFPGIVRSNDDPSYDLALVFLCFAVAFGIRHYWPD